MNQAEIRASKACYVFHADYLLGLFVDPEDVGDKSPPRYQLTFNGLHGVISQKTVRFIATAVTASNPVQTE
jgi:hypothetical protein